jgi:hypothetical protein
MAGCYGLLYAAGCVQCGRGSVCQGPVFTHLFASIKIYNGYAADKQLTVHFSTQYFSVLVKRDNAIHLAQTYFYKTPLDVIYYC